MSKSAVTQIRNAFSTYPEVLTAFEEILRTYGNGSIPKLGETATLSLGSPKRGALFFDRIWGGGYPEEVLFFGNTDAEIFALAATLLSDDFLTLEERHPDRQILNALKSENPERFDLVVRFIAIQEMFLRGLSRYSSPRFSLPDQTLYCMARYLGESIFHHHGIGMPILYDETSVFEAEYRPGSYEVLIYSLSDLNIVDEKDLTWDQVLELRRDDDAKVKLRQLRNWLDTGMVGKTKSQIADEIGISISNYEWAVKKHGIKTVIGSIHAALDPKFLAGAGAAVGGVSLSGDPLLAALAGGAIFLGKISLSVASALVDIVDTKRASNPEVAYIIELKKNVKKASREYC